MHSKGLRITSKLIACIVAAVLPWGYVPIVSEASFYKTEDKLADTIDKTIPIIEEIFQQKKDKALSALKGYISQKGWDYEYTMQAYYDAGNPYKNYDYDALIAAYATVSEFGRGNGGLLSDVPMLSMEIDEEPVPGDEEKKYGVPRFKVLDAEGLIKHYGYGENKKVEKVFKDKQRKIENALTNESINQQMFVLTPKSVSSEETDYTKYLSSIPEDISEYERVIVETALSLSGQVPYQWGGKAKSGGYDSSWWTFKDGEQRGLDCSGFVQWVYMTVGYGKNVTDSLISTSSILGNVSEIKANELRPGDIGLMNHTNNGTNHCGIYLGNNLWVHCSSSRNTVACTEFDFKYFFRIPQVDKELTSVYNGIKYTNKNNSGGQEVAQGDNSGNTPFSGISPASVNLAGREQDIDLLARLIEHEAGNQGYNGWVAVGEVVLNRVLSKAFPDSIEEVIYQSGQFTNANELKNVSPREGIKEVAEQLIKGTVRLFNNVNVMYFRNPSYAGIKATDPIDWGKNKWFTSVGNHAFYTQG